MMHATAHDGLLAATAGWHFHACLFRAPCSNRMGGAAAVCFAQVCACNSFQQVNATLCNTPKYGMYASAFVHLAGFASVSHDRDDDSNGFLVHYRPTSNV